MRDSAKLPGRRPHRWWIVACGLACGCPGSDDPQNAGTSDGASSSTEGSSSTTTDAGTGTSTTEGGSSGGSTGTTTACGDGIIDAPEACDNGPDNADDAACKSDCTEAFCGDGLVHDGIEACDDANDDNDDSCTELCAAPTCGDGLVQTGEECDDGEDNANDAACKSACLEATCGDTLVHAGVEECDDGNLDNDDACTELCAAPTCGDGFVQTGNAELCDDGDQADDDECANDCTSAGAFTGLFNGAADGNDLGHDAAFDTLGNLIAVGSTVVTDQSDNVWIRKYEPTGSVDWTHTFHSVTSDQGFGVATSGTDIYVAGSLFTNSNDRDIWVRRFITTGEPAWSDTINGGDDGADEGLGVAIDSAGYILVTGYVTETDTARDIWVGKFPPGGGTATWTVTEAAVGDDDDEGHGVAIDSNDNVVVAGFMTVGVADRDVWVRKYTSGGVPIWTRTYASSANANDEANGVAVDTNDAIVVAGYESTTTAGEDIWIRKYDAAGTTSWTVTYNAPQDGTDIGNDVATDSSDNIVVVGSVYRGSQSDNIWIRKYDTDGNELWTSTYNSDGFGSDVGRGVGISSDDHIGVAGYETRSDLGEARNVWVRRINQ